MSKIGGHICQFYEMEGRIKPNSGCANCPFWLKDNCTDKGVILHIGTYLENVKGRIAYTVLRSSMTRLIGRYGIDAVRWAALESNVIALDALKISGSEYPELDRALVVLGKKIEVSRERARHNRVWRRLDASELSSALEKISLYEFQGGSDSGGFGKPYCICCKMYDNKHIPDCPVEVIERWLELVKKKEEKKIKKEQEEIVKQEERKKEVSLDTFK